MSNQGPLGEPRLTSVGPLVSDRQQRKPSLAVIVVVDSQGKLPPRREDEPERFMQEMRDLERQGKQVVNAFAELDRIGVEAAPPTQFIFRLGKAGTTLFIEEAEGVANRLEQVVEDRGYTTEGAKVGII